MLRITGVVVLSLLGSQGLAAVAPAKAYCVLMGREIELQNADGDRLGDALSAQECGQARRAAGPALICAKYGTQWFLTLATSLQKVGSPLTLNDCAAVSVSSGPELYCNQQGSGARPWFPIHLRTRVAFGRFGTSLADCQVLTKNSVPGLVCTNTGTYNFAGRKPTRVDENSYSDANLMGASGQQEFCAQATAGARNGFVCVCNGDFCGTQGWVRYDVARHQSSGPTTDIASCIASQRR